MLENLSECRYITCTVEDTKRKGKTMRLEAKKTASGFEAGGVEAGTLAELRRELAKRHSVEPRSIVLVVTR